MICIRYLATRACRSNEDGPGFRVGYYRGGPDGCHFEVVNTDRVDGVGREEDVCERGAWVRQERGKWDEKNM